MKMYHSMVRKTVHMPNCRQVIQVETKRLKVVLELECNFEPVIVGDSQMLHRSANSLQQSSRHLFQGAGTHMQLKSCQTAGGLMCHPPRSTHAAQVLSNNNLAAMSE
ncbi:hypothetical protein JTE90_001039 [Oedothorax gibbosus]|uniref:Uncharacterized protein n=1 Tax=Oedothorax gibbosus TaxID=931172 RepID=A0AAV6TJ66_9ARAC|nr:hypothetical protein JTE90_001039 [Oedothorax gibbosus]